MSIKIYGPVKSRTFRVLWTLSELKMPFEHVPLDLSKGEHKSDWFLKINPNGKVPAMEHEGKFLFESAAICIYLSDISKNTKLMPPTSDFKRALVNQWLHFCMSEFEAHLWLMARHSFIYPEDQRIPAVKPLAALEFQKSLKVVENSLGKNDYLVENEFTLADIFICQSLYWAKMNSALDLSSKAIQAYMERCKARELFPRN